MIEAVMIRQATKAGVIKWRVGGIADLSFPTSKTRRGRVLDAMANIEAIKPVMQRQILLGNRKMGSSKEQTAQDVKDFGKHIDTAITAMTMIYGLMEENGFEEMAATKKGGTGEWIRL